MTFHFFEHTTKIAPEIVARPETKEGFVPIRACIIDCDNIDSFTQQTIDEITKNGTDVDYFADHETLIKNGMKNLWEKTYVISKCDDTDKYTLGLIPCMAIVVTGKGLDGKEISFLTHQNPKAVLLSFQKEFTLDLSESIKEIREKTEKGSIDVVMVGGNNNKGFSENEKFVKFLSSILEKELGFEPIVMMEPNLYNNPTDTYYDTSNRRLFIVRPYYNSDSNESFLPSEIEEKSKKW